MGELKAVLNDIISWVDSISDFVAASASARVYENVSLRCDIEQ